MRHRVLSAKVSQGAAKAAPYCFRRTLLISFLAGKAWTGGPGRSGAAGLAAFGVEHAGGEAVGRAEGMGRHLCSEN
ncbi:hypothetical protein D7X48_05455 [bacterium D16-50]|nr:hypothetical protein D7X48_05455 [bacterium D16-50]